MLLASEVAAVEKKSTLSKLKLIKNDLRNLIA